MPLSKIETIGKGSAWGLWEIAETEPDLSYLSMESCPDDIAHPQKRLEWLAGRVLVKSLAEHVGLTYEGIQKDGFGKPSLKMHPHPISLSHSFPYVAAQIDPMQSVGIDLEQIKEKLRHVGPRVLSPEEFDDAGGDLVKLCIYWCAKEALYKIHGVRNLLFTDHLRVHPFSLAEQGNLRGVIEADNNIRGVWLGFRVTGEYVLVYTDTTRKT